GIERLSARAGVADLDRRLARRHLRRASRLHGRRHRVRPALPAVCGRPDNRRAHRRSRAAGAAGALVTPSSLAIIVAAFAPKERAAAIGSWTAWGGIAAIVGPLAGGWIVDQVSWRWIFALNVPLAVAALALILTAVPRAERLSGRTVDAAGASLCALGLAGFVFALIEEPRYGWSSPAI